jgi:uncharacterized protein (TIGR02996 family)
MFPADEHPFLEAIAATPSADGPRLVYADFLEETGNPLDARRAELVRLQVALDRVAPEHSRGEELANRARELVDAHGRDWTAPLASLGVEFQFRRGIPDAVSIDAAAFLARGEELFDNTQIRSGRSFIRRVKLRNPARVLATLGQCPLLEQIEELDLDGSDLGNGGVNLLLKSPWLGKVKSLALGNNRLDDAGAVAVARADTMPQLRSLALNDNGQIGSTGAAALADSPFLAGLIELDLSGNDVNEFGLQEIVEGKAAARWQMLQLFDNPIGNGFTSFASSELFSRLLTFHSHLDLHHCGIESGGAEALAASPHLPRLTRLNLSENYLGDGGVAALCRGRFESLRTLRLAQNQLTDASASTLLGTPMRHLELLDISGNRLTHHGLEALKEAAKAHGFLLEAANNGTETMMPLPPELAPRPEVDQVVDLKRGLAFPARHRPASRAPSGAG